MPPAGSARDGHGHVHLAATIALLSSSHAPHHPLLGVTCGPPTPKYCVYVCVCMTQLWRAVFQKGNLAQHPIEPLNKHLPRKSAGHSSIQRLFPPTRRQAASVRNVFFLLLLLLYVFPAYHILGGADNFPRRAQEKKLVGLYIRQPRWPMPAIRRVHQQTGASCMIPHVQISGVARGWAKLSMW